MRYFVQYIPRQDKKTIWSLGAFLGCIFKIVFPGFFLWHVLNYSSLARCKSPNGPRREITFFCFKIQTKQV